MKEEEKQGVPEWMDEMLKWQAEDPKRRALLCVCADNKGSMGTMVGNNLHNIHSLFGCASRDGDIGHLIRDVVDCLDNPARAMAMKAVWARFCEDSGIEQNEIDNDIFRDEINSMLN